jgi:hypothetical protein
MIFFLIPLRQSNILIWKSLVNQPTSTKTRTVCVLQQPKMGFPYSYCFDVFLGQYFAMLSNVCLFFLPKWWKQILAPITLLWRKSLTATAHISKETVGKYFFTDAPVYPPVSEKRTSTKFPLSRNFHTFLDRTYSYFSFCWHFPDCQLSIISNSSWFSFVPLVEAICGRPLRGSLWRYVFLP